MESSFPQISLSKKPQCRNAYLLRFLSRRHSLLLSFLRIYTCSTIFTGTNQFIILSYIAMQGQNWIPLESNPQVINTFIAKMGLKIDVFSFQEMLSTQEWALEMIPRPALGILFLYQQTPFQEDFNDLQAESLKPEQANSSLFFMKQYARNACGTIALFHILLNACAKYPEIIKQGSQLATFKEKSLAKSYKERGSMFEKSSQIMVEHSSAAHQGQSEAVDECNSHFIAIIPFEGRIYELDGCKKCPVDHGECAEDNFIVKGSEIIKTFMQRDPQNNNFSMIVLAKTEQ